MSQRWLEFLCLTALVAAGCSDEDPGPRTEAGVVPADAAVPAGDAAAARPDATEAGAEAGRPDGNTPDAKVIVADASSRDSAAVDAAAAADPSSKVVGSAGGTLMINEGKLFIPPGALDKNATITFRTASAHPPLPGRASSSVVVLEPHGQTFAQPVRLTLYHFGGPAKVALYTAPPSGAFAPVPGATVTLNTAEVALSHFSYFVVAPLIPVDAGADAARDAAAGVVDARPHDLAADGSADAAGPEDAAAPPPDTTPDAAADVAPDASSPDAGPTGLVRVRGEVLSFDPKITLIKAGATVTWTWEASNNHSVASGGVGGTSPGSCAKDGRFNSGVKATGETFSFTFPVAGSYGYHCAAHCTQFEGGVIVVQ